MFDTSAKSDWQYAAAGFCVDQPRWQYRGIDGYFMYCLCISNTFYLFYADLGLMCERACVVFVHEHVCLYMCMLACACGFTIF